MNLRDLRYLVALDEHRHFGRAAEACFVSQPTLSTQLKKLEKELDTVLIERAPREVLFTDAGKAVLAQAREILERADRIRGIARQAENPGACTLRVGIFPTLAPYLLPHILPKVHQRFPQLELLLVEEKTEEVLARLRAGRLDAVLVALPVPDETLHTEYLFDEPFVLALHESHPLASHRTIAFDDLAGQRLLLLEEGHCLRDQALEVCHLAGASERSGFRATSLETLRYMVAAGVGVTLLPVLATQPPVARAESVRLVPFRKPVPHRKIAMLWRTSSPMGGMLNELAEVFRKLPPALLSSTRS
ncbi:MAG: DNA-binding transcriptional regulator OxyR [Gammaproteobacteria bacterium]